MQVGYSLSTAQHAPSVDEAYTTIYRYLGNTIH